MKKRTIKKGKRFNLRKEYENCWRYVKESKSFIYYIIGIFLLFALAGFFIQVPEDIYNKIMLYIKELLKQTEGLSAFGIIKFITFNNIRSTLFAIILGIFLGIYPLVSALVNGYLLGFVSSMSVSWEGIFSLWKILPHGIFELPAVFISLGLGLKLGMFIFQKEKLKSFKNYFINSLKVFLLVVVPLLIVAGIIEGVLIALAR
jgi:stage II sporulation protein M